MVHIFLGVYNYNYVFFKFFSRVRRSRLSLSPLYLLV